MDRKMTENSISQSNSESTMFFRDLAEKLRLGDNGALEQMWDRFGNELRRRARTRLRQYGITRQHESMDICNAVMLDLMNQREINIRQPKDVLRYFRRAIDNQVRDVIKSLTRDRRDIRREENSPVESHNVVNSGTTPSFFLLREEIFHKVESYLAEDGDRIVQMVRENFGWKEIGDALGTSPDSIRMRWNRAIQKVQSDSGFDDSSIG